MALARVVSEDHRDIQVLGRLDKCRGKEKGYEIDPRRTGPLTGPDFREQTA